MNYNTNHKFVGSDGFMAHRQTALPKMLRLPGSHQPTAPPGQTDQDLSESNCKNLS